MKQGSLYGRGAKGKATALHAKIVRARGVCARCGASGPGANLQCAHIVSRSFAWTRTDENGSWCMCAKCHFLLTNDPFEHVSFAVQSIGQEAYDALRRKAHDGIGRKISWDDELVRLQALAASLGVAA